jgi:hypothetical protein
MKKLFAAVLLSAWVGASAWAQTIRVDPTGVNVNSQNPTVVYLTFGPLVGYRPAEAVWCGELIPAMPALGLKCDPATIYGSLPARYNLARASGSDGFTDIMSIPPSVVRRAYQAAARGADAGFFYVRRFTSTGGGPDQFVSVTCRMTGGGARVPLALTDVRLSFGVDTPLLFVKSGEKVAGITADIRYNGTGRLKGRWEVVMPGDEPPSDTDLVTEATLPIEDRGRQRRYTEVARFNVFLPPHGKYTLPGPEPDKIPTTLEGQYLLLLRIEASDDKEGDSNLAAVGVGPGVVHSGAVAGFPLPVLKYFVGVAPKHVVTAAWALISPAENAMLAGDQDIAFSWTDLAGAALYRLDITDTDGAPVLSAFELPGKGLYRAPSWFKDRAGTRTLRWRVVALEERGSVISETAWRNFKLVQPER